MKDDLKKDEELEDEVHENLFPSKGKQTRREKVDNFKLEIQKLDSDIENDVNVEDREIKSFSNLKTPSDRDETLNKNIETKKFIPKKSADRKKLFKLVWIFMVVSISLMLGQYFVFGFCDMLAMNRDEQVVVVEIPKNSSKSDIADLLYEKGVIKNKSFFKAYITLTKSSSKFIPGTFEIKTNMDYEGIVSYLKTNSNRLETDIVNVTVPEGKNVMEVAAILEKNEICSQDEFLKACKSKEFETDYNFLASLKNADKLCYKVEGYLFPDTYKFYKNVDPTTVVKKMLGNYKKRITTTDGTDGAGNSVNIATRAQKAGISMEDLINLASLIQAEAANEADMYIISSVIYNRLATASKNGVSQFGEPGLDYLGIDSTVWYPYRSRDKVPSELLGSYERPYDTYKNKGLTIGPICNPGIAAIDAALSPKNTQYYYFCHSKDGKAFYSKTMGEHQNNLKKAGLS
ncbi:MAG: Endolytic murein transglycosylase [Eubacteriales bacterium SKADARSKE-1]|nr:Endolytic murein transglycosylase [Eubacteriales bacterium SKADARSKE-1]